MLFVSEQNILVTKAKELAGTMGFELTILDIASTLNKKSINLSSI